MAMNIDDLDFNDDDPIIQNINNDDGSQQPDFDSLDQEKPWLDGTEGGKSTNSSPAEPEPKQEPEIEEDIILSLFLNSTSLVSSLNMLALLLPMLLQIGMY